MMDELLKKLRQACDVCGDLSPEGVMEIIKGEFIEVSFEGRPAGLLLKREVSNIQKAGLRWEGEPVLCADGRYRTPLEMSKG